eukprot:CAMPEP_0178381076 /NCGR_PEP_ID=MMETSP0689_2-20121128/5796_1 /TAXON_ID=160604 /ORGANISM="Amphidinium massartii, Strain CS-259" /LENGTH=472 /DNA_ID=CAMNT_0020001247 /DNA_START=98 /DNA_END=1516 /DNA_ORIENTATION=+
MVLSALIDGYKDDLLFFVRTLVACPQPALQNGAAQECPRGSRLSGHGCVAVANGSPDWSGSSKCADFEFVLHTSLRFQGFLGVVSGIGDIASMAAVAGPFIAKYGECNAMMLGIGMGVPYLCTMLVACHVGLTTTIQWAMLLVTGLHSVASIYGVALQALIAECLPTDAGVRGLAYTTIQVALTLSAFAGQFAAYVISRQDYDDYSAVIMGLLLLNVCLSLSGYAFLQQGRARGAGQVKMLISTPLLGDDVASQCTHAQDGDERVVVGWQRPLRPILADPWLTRICLCVAVDAFAGSLASCTASAYALDVIRFTQSEATLCSFFMMICGLGGSCAGSALGVSWLTTYQVYCTGSLLAGAGCMFGGSLGASAIHTDTLRVYYVAGFGLASLGTGMCSPAFLALASLRLKAREEGQLFAMFGVIAGLGGIAGSVVFSNWVARGDSGALVTSTCLTSLLLLVSYACKLALHAWYV